MQITDPTTDLINRGACRDTAIPGDGKKLREMSSRHIIAVPLRKLAKNKNPQCDVQSGGAAMVKSEWAIGIVFRYGMHMPK